MEDHTSQNCHLLNAKELATMLSTSVRSIWRYRSSGRLPKAIQIAGAIRWRKTDIEQWISIGCPDQKTFEAIQQAESE